MTPETARPDEGTAVHRLRLDLEDLRFENARLKTSIAERQDEIVALSERLGALQTSIEKIHRVTAWSRHLRRFSPLRLMLRRR